MAKITVLVADAQRLFAQCLAGMLDRDAEFWLLEDLPGTVKEAIETAEVFTPDVVLLDQWMPGMEAPAAVRSIHARVPDCKIILLSWFHTPDHIRSAIDAGAAGYLPKSVAVEEVAEAVRRVHLGEAPVFPSRLGKLVQTLDRRGEEVEELAERFAKLSPRQLEILIILSRGEPIEDVADQLSISPLTLKTHIRNILAKTGARSHSEAVAMALRIGWIQI